MALLPDELNLPYPKPTSRPVRRAQKNPPKGPRIGTGVLLWSHKEQGFVLMKRQGSHQANTWNFPGGSVETNEILANAAAREVFEELGVKVEANYFLFSEDLLGGDGGHWITMYFFAETYDAVRIMEPKKCSEIGYFKGPSDILKLNLFPGTDRAVTMSWIIVPHRIQALYSGHMNADRRR